MAELLLCPLADAFMQVGVFVAALIALVGCVRWRHGDRLLALLQRPHWAPAIGAVLGVTPGCAGAILVMPLYARGSVSFGGVIAALVATMGDSSWVIMAADPGAALGIHAILLGTGLVSGYAVDALGIKPSIRRSTAPSNEVATVSASRVASPSAPAGVPTPTAATVPRRGFAAVAVPPGAGALDVVVLGFWMLAGIGLVVAVPVGFQLADPRMLASALGGVDPYLALGSAGTLAAFGVFVSARGKLADDSVGTAHASAGVEPFSTVLRHGARETSFVIVWVAAAYLAWALLEAATGFDGTQLPLTGWVGVVVGATIGLVPGCAVQIVLTGLYVSGAVPFSTLIANAVSQDGDALLPLIVMESRSAVAAVCITTVPGLAVGGLSLLLV